MLSDSIADMLTRIRNGYLVKKDKVVVPYSKIKEQLGKVLVKENFLKDIKTELESKNKKNLILGLNYKNKTPVIKEMVRISKPGLRIYVKRTNIPKVLEGIGIVIISTSRGIMTGKEAKKKGLGGELIAKVW